MVGYQWISFSFREVYAMRLILMGVCVCLLLSACGPAATVADPPTPTALRDQVSVAMATESAPTATPSLTATPAVTATALPSPSPTASPTALPVPTATSAPTMTATPLPMATLPPTGDRTPVRLVIPAINLDRALYPVGLDANNVPIVLDHEVGWYLHSARPGQGDNIVLWGHVLRFRKAPHIPAPFAEVERLALGSEILLYSADGSVFRYVVTRKERVTPDQVAHILPTGDERLTLVSCIGDRVIVDGNVELTHRLITIATPER